MARKVKTEQSGKKKKILKVILIIFISLIVVAGVAFGVYKFVLKKEPGKTAVEIKLLDSLEEYGYSLSDKDSDLMKDEYNILKDLLNSDTFSREEYAKQVAKIFVIDLYTISTKVNKLDIGGSEYYYLDKVSMYEKKVMDTLYSNLLDNTYGDRKQALPEVKSVEIVSTEETKYKIGEEEKSAFLVKLKWTYVKDMGYDAEGSVVLCKEDGVRVSVVDFQPTLEPEYEE
jgi:flagellar basal body-associated protein FliL